MVADRSSGAVAVLSVKPEYAARIVAGSKRVEFRRLPFGKAVSHFVLYATKPVGRPIALCEIAAIHRDAPAAVWRGFGHVGGIGADRFWAYYRGAHEAVAISIRVVTPLLARTSLRDLGILGPPPQSYCYLDDAVAMRLVRRHQRRAALPHG